MNIRPVYDRLVIDPVEEQKATAAGIVIPDTAKKKAQVAVVRAVGVGRNFDAPGGYELFESKLGGQDTLRYFVTVHRPKMICQAGDYILYGKYSGTEVVLEMGKPPVIILREDEVLAVLEFAEGERRPGDPEPEAVVAEGTTQAEGSDAPPPPEANEQ